MHWIEDLVQQAVEGGASYADVRLVNRASEQVRVWDGKTMLVDELHLVRLRAIGSHRGHAIDHAGWGDFDPLEQGIMQAATTQTVGMV